MDTRRAEQTKIARLTVNYGKVLDKTEDESEKQADNSITIFNI